MALTTVAKLKEYTGVYPDVGDTMQQSYIDSASEVVKNYLGYDPEQSMRTRYYDGPGDNEIYLGARPVTLIDTVRIDGSLVESTLFGYEDESIFYLNSKTAFEKGKKNIQITFKAGYAAGSSELSLIEMTVLRIAALMQEEGQNNIGITSKSWEGEGSRTFVSYENYDKYLRPISAYRIVR